MQQIFYNANVLTINSAFESAEAILTNDETIVFVGSNEEVLKMKTNETTLVDLNGKTIIPSLFCTEIKIYETIEQRLKNANLVNFIENYDKNDENYEKFDNFEVYKNEFLNIQDELIKMGITTVQELGINQIQFAFWKKLSETNLIKIDIIGYVDLLQAKDVMDNNCRSYRKYKNHFRLGGYYLALDGKLLAKKAWLNKPYKFEHKYVGYSSVLSEQFEMLIKTALEEKHQLIVEANGDRAIEQYIEIVKSVFEKNKDEDKFKPVIFNSNLVTRKHLKELSKLGVSINFDITPLISQSVNLKKTIGLLRFKKLVQTKLVKKYNIDMLFHFNYENIKNFFYVIKFLIERISNDNILVGKSQKIDIVHALNYLINNSAEYCFEGAKKGSLESGKLCNFIVLSNNILDAKINLTDTEIEKVYQNSKLIYEKK